ncbi:MAG TPA: pyridoxamine 5'-phosphate oxidase family protein [Prolixibacteraceae bacterium]|nr:pyridoxamine 5'-phosphate oxidase family protein [Prolixibacteraceae bacterium]
MRTYEIVDRNEIEAILAACRTAYLGLADRDQRPYVVPMNFGYRDGTIYLHSAQSGRKWEIMQSNPKACITFCLGDELAWQHEQVACSYRMKSKTVIAEGKIEFIDDDDEKTRAMNILMAQYSDRIFTYSKPAIRNVGVFKMKIERLAAREFGAKAVTVWNR